MEILNDFQKVEKFFELFNKGTLLSYQVLLEDVNNKIIYFYFSEHFNNIEKKTSKILELAETENTFYYFYLDGIKIENKIKEGFPYSMVTIKFI